VTKTELVRVAAAKSGASQKAVARILDAVLEAVKEAAARGDRVSLPGFGAFVVVTQAARQVRSPKGETVDVPARKAVRFRAGKALREAVK